MKNTIMSSKYCPIYEMYLYEISQHQNMDVTSDESFPYL